MPHDHHDLAPTDAGPNGDRTPSVSPSPHGGPLGAAWNAVTAVIATVMGLAPHVLHHVGLFAGAAFVIGPAISNPEPADAPRPARTPSPVEHSAHHTG